MAHFIPVKDVSVIFYGGTRCSRKSSAEITKPHLVDKARRNPDFEEVDKQIKATRKTKPKKPANKPGAKAK